MRRSHQQHPGRSLQAWLTLLLFSLTSNGVRADAEPAPLVMGLLPFVSPITLYKRFAPLREHLSRELGREVIFATAPTFSRFKTETERGEYDIVLTAPHFVPAALDSGHYHLQATPTNSLSAHLVVRADSEARTLADLRDPLVATPPDSAIITIIGKKQFGQMGLRASRFESYNSHNAAYQAMLRHRADAAIISVNVLNKAVEEHRPLRVIAQSSEFPGVGILTATRLPDDLEQKLQTALATLGNSDKGGQILHKIGYPGFRVAEPQFYAPFRELLRND